MSITGSIGSIIYGNGQISIMYMNSISNYNGLIYNVYDGYFRDSVTFFDTAAYRSGGNGSYTGTNSNISSINAGTNGYVPDNGSWSNYSVQWLGYFKPDVTGEWTFWTESDDASYLWIGDNAVSGYNTSNALVGNGGVHGMAEKTGNVILTAGIYYPIRIQFGEQGGSDNMIVSFQGPSGSSASTKRMDGTGFYFYNI